MREGWKGRWCGGEGGGGLVRKVREGVVVGKGEVWVVVRGEEELERVYQEQIGIDHVI